MFSFEVRFYNDNSDKVAWVFKKGGLPLNTLMSYVRRCADREQTLCVLNPEHPDYLTPSFMQARNTNIMVRKNGKLIKWKHLLG